MKKNLVTMIAILLCASHAQAQSTDALTEGAKMCTRHLPRYERQYGIPTHLLSAIASTESGRYHEGLGIKVPWPWTINAEGKGYYFDSKSQAVAAAHKLRSQGIKSMDLGCMQVNIMHHPQAFGSIEEAFEPQKNIAYAASFLRNLYEDDKSWKQAAADYHSKTPALGSNYVGQVYNSWYQIVGKLRQAKLQLPDNSVMAQMNEPIPPKPASPPKPQVTAQNKPVAKNTYKISNTNFIKVSSASQPRSNDILVVRPDIKLVDAPVQTSMDSKNPDILPPTAFAMAQEKSASLSPTVTDAHIIRVGGDSLVKSTTIKSGPNFIFSD